MLRVLFYLLYSVECMLRMGVSCCSKNREQDSILVKTTPHTSVVRALDLKTGGCGFDSQAGQPNND